MKRLIVTLILALGLVQIAAAYECDGTQECEAQENSEFAFTEPNVTPLTPNTNLMQDRWYMRVNVRTEVHDAPGGNVVRVIEPGFNFVTALEESDGWTRINGNEWVLSENLATSNWIVSSFTGVLLPAEGLSHPMAWALVNLYPSPEPGANPSEQFDFVPRYTRLSIYDTAVVDGHRWYLIGEGQWVHQFNVAKVIPVEARPEDVDTELWMSIDLYEQVLVAYDGVTPIFATLISTGLPRWPTYEGVFHIYYRNPREFMSWGVVGDDFYSLEEVPWTMFFDEGRALHGAYWHDGFGYRRSHGCVNMSITDSHWLYQWVADYMGSHRSADREEGPAVYVYSSDKYE